MNPYTRAGSSVHRRPDPARSWLRNANTAPPGLSAIALAQPSITGSLAPQAVQLAQDLYLSHIKS
jgi:hypothetical protein